MSDAGCVVAAAGSREVPDLPPELSVRALALLAAVMANGPGRLAHLTMRGRVMAPLLIDGDVIAVEPLRGRPRLGAIVIARSRVGDPVCHRVVATTGGGWVLAGDRCDSAEWHPRDALVGRVVEVARGRRRLLLERPLRRPGDAALARWHGWTVRWQRSRWAAVRVTGRLLGRAERLLRSGRSRLAWLGAGRSRRGWRTGTSPR